MAPSVLFSDNVVSDDILNPSLENKPSPSSLFAARLRVRTILDRIGVSKTMVSFFFFCRIHRSSRIMRLILLKVD